MARKGIHPELHEVEVHTFNKDGSELVFKTLSTLNVPSIVAEINIHNHPAWKDDSVIDKESSVNKIMQKFNNKFKYKIS